MRCHTLNFIVISVNLVMTSLSQSSTSDGSKFNSTRTSDDAIFVCRELYVYFQSVLIFCFFFCVDDMYDWASPTKVLTSEEYLENHDNWSLVTIGNDADGLVQYVGHAYHENELLPGKVKLYQNYFQRLFGVYTKKIYVACDGQEYEKSNYEV